jgi:hypothetical protein
VAHFPLHRSRVRSRGPLEWPFEESSFDHGEQNFFDHVHLLTNVQQAFKYVFTSPSSADQDEPRATRAGNAYIHGMSHVTEASLVYIATQVSFDTLLLDPTEEITQVRFALCSSSTFSHTDAVTDSETFYNSILDLLADPDEREEVRDLLTWWNR